MDAAGGEGGEVRARARHSIVKAARRDDERVLRDLIHEPVFVVDAPRPEALELMAQRLGFADPVKRIARRLGDQPRDSLEQHWVAFRPVGKMRKSLRVKNDPPHRNFA